MFLGSRCGFRPFLPLVVLVAAVSLSPAHAADAWTRPELVIAPSSDYQARDTTEWSGDNINLNIAAGTDSYKTTTAGGPDGKTIVTYVFERRVEGHSHNGGPCFRAKCVSEAPPPTLLLGQAFTLKVDITVEQQCQYADTGLRFQIQTRPNAEPLWPKLTPPTAEAGKLKDGSWCSHAAYSYQLTIPLQTSFKVYGSGEEVSGYLSFTLPDPLAGIHREAKRPPDIWAAYYRFQGGERRTFDSPITSRQIELYLDFLAGQLQAGVERAQQPALDPLYDPLTPGPGTAPGPAFTYAQAATLGESVWLECEGLIKAHIDKRLQLNEAQKQRLKAFGWWASFLVLRNQVYLHPPVGTDDGEGAARGLGKPEYPLFGAIATPVQTPPQCVGGDVMTVCIPYWSFNNGRLEWSTEGITEDYAQAAFHTALRLADQFYCNGLVYNAYVVTTSPDRGQVALTAATSIPGYGKYISALMCAYVEANAIYGYWSNGKDPLTWDQHLANISALSLMGIQAYRTYSPNAIRARAAGGIDEGRIPPEVADRYEGKSYRITNRQNKQLPGGETIQVGEAEYAIVGPYKGKPDPKAPFAIEKRSVAIKTDSEGNQRFFALEGDKLGDPIYFLGEKGYHIWSHLTEIKSGHPTGFRSLQQVLDERPDYVKTLTEIEAKMRSPGGSLQQAQDSYIGFVNKLVDDGSYEKMQGFYQFTTKKRDGTVVPVGGKEANSFLIVPRPTSDPGQVTHYTIRVSIDPDNGRLMNVFAHSPADASQRWMSTFLAESLQKHFYAWSASDKLIFKCPSLSVIMPASGDDRDKQH